MEVEELRLKLLNNLNNYSKEEIEEIEKAYELAKDLHSSQVRQSGEPYIIHPLSVAIILSEYIDVRDMRQPYPCIAHESFWAMRFFNMRDSSKLIKDSFQYLSDLVKTCECIQVDFQNTDIVPSKILKKR